MIFYLALLYSMYMVTIFSCIDWIQLHVLLRHFILNWSIEFYKGAHFLHKYLILREDIAVKYIYSYLWNGDHIIGV